MKCYGIASSQEKSIRAPSTRKNMILPYEIDRNGTGRNDGETGPSKKVKNAIHTHT